MPVIPAAPKQQRHTDCVGGQSMVCRVSSRAKKKKKSGDKLLELEEKLSKRYLTHKF